MKGAITILVVLVLLVVAVTPAFAAGKNPNSSGGNKHDATEVKQHPEQSRGESHKTETKPVTPGKGTKTGDLPKASQDDTPVTGPQSHGKSSMAPGQLKKLSVPGVITPTVSARPFKSVVASGTILAVDPISGTVTIQVLAGNARAQAAYSQTITVTLSAPTRYQVWTPDGATWGSVDDLQVGDTVMLKGWTTVDGWSADWLKVGLGLGRERDEISDND